MEFNYIVYIFLFNIPKFFHSYNIDINSPYLKTIQVPKGSLFGFSVNIFTRNKTKEKYILVGAPRDNLKLSQKVETGAAYSCPISKELTDCSQFALKSDSESSSLFGYVIDSNSASESIYACAPRFISSFVNGKYVEGSCWEFNSGFEEIEHIMNSDCYESIKSNIHHHEFRNCLTGGSLKSFNNKQILLTAPYSYKGSGLLINSIFNPHENSRSSHYLKFENYDMFSTYQFAGFSMSTGNIFRKGGVTTVLLGAPGISQYNSIKTNMIFGQVFLVKLNGNSVTYSGTVFGEQFGSGFGYSVLAIDIDGDGYDEMIVGAPYTNNNEGQVFVYWNKDLEAPSNDSRFRIPFNVQNRFVLISKKKSSRAQFGLCLENLGDINSDSIMDFAVGAPFDNDGSGSVYVFLGNRNQILTLSQKIEAQAMSPDIRGFGFSIFGQNTDLDMNSYPDFLVGASISGHVVGLRSRPLVRIYADNMLDESDTMVPYNFDEMRKCQIDGQDISCIEVNISIHYYYPHLSKCLPNSEPKTIDYQIELDFPFLQTTSNKRVYFENQSNSIKKKASINCRLPGSPAISTLSTLKILFPVNIFFNVSVPIELKLKWFFNVTDVPKRNFTGGPLQDLSLYPILEQQGNQLINQIKFGAGCTSETCKPILTIQPTLSLPRDGEEFLLFIGNISKFKLDVPITNIAMATTDRAYRTYIKLNFDSKNIILSPVGSERRTVTEAGLIYSVISPLNPQQTDNAVFEFTLSNDFIQSTSQYIYFNISIEAMFPQPHLKPINLKIRIKMVADISMKVSVMPDNYPYKDNQILGFNGITSEEKIGPKMKFTITISNNIANSVVVSSKLLIYFPWEIAGNPDEKHGQFMLYLLRSPKFSISAGKKDIYCDYQSIQNLTNIIKTRVYQTNTEQTEFKDVLLKNISLPSKRPFLPQLSKQLIFHSKDSDSTETTDWENTVVVDCLKGSGRCIPIVCDLGPLSRQSGEITLNFDIRIWVHTLIENFIKYKFVNIHMPVYWIPLVNYDIVLRSPDGDFKSALIVAVNFRKPKPPPSLDVIYAVLIAVSVGVLLLATIVIILYQCKFFRRPTIGNRKRK